MKHDNITRHIITTLIILTGVITGHTIFMIALATALNLVIREEQGCRA